MKKFKQTLVGFTGLALGATLASAQVTVYEDTFDGDGIGTNTKTGGGMTSLTIFQNSFVDAPATGGLIAGTNSNAARRTVASTDNAFDLSAGATIEVHWQGSTAKTGYYDFSLTKLNLATSSPSIPEGIFTQFDSGDTDGDGASSREGFGFAWGSFRGQDGLYSNDGGGAGAPVSVSTIENDGAAGTYNATGTNTIFLLTVNADGSYSYTVTGNAVETASGSGAAGSIDLSGNRFFNAYAQPTGQFNYVKISVPDSGSLRIKTIAVNTLTDEATMTFTGAPNTTYVCKSSTDLSSFPTTEVPTGGSLTTDGSGNGSVDVDATGTKKFYRLEDLP